MALQSSQIAPETAVVVALAEDEIRSSVRRNRGSSLLEMTGIELVEEEEGRRGKDIPAEGR